MNFLNQNNVPVFRKSCCDVIISGASIEIMCTKPYYLCVQVTVNTFYTQVTKFSCVLNLLTCAHMLLSCAYQVTKLCVQVSKGCI